MTCFIYYTIFFKFLQDFFKIKKKESSGITYKELHLIMRGYLLSLPIPQVHNWWRC